MTDFKLVHDDILPHWIDVIYPNEDKPRYMINQNETSCTCVAASMSRSCKHIEAMLAEADKLTIPVIRKESFDNIAVENTQGLINKDLLHD
jgi:hypothetical protein